MKTPRIKKRSVKQDADAEHQSNLAFYGALNIINRGRIAKGEEPHAIPERYRVKCTRPILKVKGDQS